ncbi:hypothetical protein RB195_021796 [Necator americanus]|uniref:Uncharacterized protein n=1 Tax=Necator americanus TaxID=51031 RepID=A0ABR1ECZ1_NECAM
MVIAGIDANAKIGLGQESDVLQKWHYPADDGGDLSSTCVSRRDSQPHRRSRGAPFPSAYVAKQRYAKATSAFNSSTKCLWSTPISKEVKLLVYLSAIRPIMMYGSETWAAPSAVMERLDCTERKMLERLLGYFWPRECHNEKVYVETDVVCRRMTRGRYQHILRRPADRLVQRVLRSLSGLSWNRPPGRKRKLRAEVVKDEQRILGQDRQFNDSDEWIDYVQALAEDRGGWAELCLRTALLGEDSGNRVRR